MGTLSDPQTAHSHVSGHQTAHSVWRLWCHLSGPVVIPSHSPLRELFTVTVYAIPSHACSAAPVIAYYV